MLNTPPPLIDGKLPVFVFPTSLTFYSDDQSSHKQVVTLYNPYDFAIRFKVLCTAPRKYSVVDSEGTIKPRCCVDIVVRHTDICINHEGIRDKFRIHVSEHGQKKVLGRKDVLSVLLPTREKTPPPEEHFESLPPMSMSPGHSQQPLVHRHTPGRPLPVASGPGVLVVCIGMVCIAALMLPGPTQGEKNTSLPEYLHLSLHQKLIAAYILGLVTMVILRA
ncbi:LOW QUALITY PROTEIN: motile sperm domain-containing protein 1-like [Liolophura sinensis]|uniref:LOW QUALITY PROTEIN: motile sperm domain-containing protein 1-like n=1 Tax=Liolophura sinensis TaxID=3198878 RepID=UPI0031594151